MQYKTDLKEKFTVVTILDATLTSNSVPEINELTQKILSQSPKNLVLNCGHGTLGWTLACGSAKRVADIIIK